MNKGEAKEACPFCEFIQTQKPFAENETFFARYDKYPVSQGHVLLIPRRHIATLFVLNERERNDCFDLLLEVRDILQRKFQPNGFNVGVNIGAAAGQTVTHLHIHVIPRYLGDVKDPQGGVRRIMPNRAKYPFQDILDA